MGILHTLALLLAIVLFVIAVWMAAEPTPEPLWKRLISVGLIFFAASFLPFPG
jgi:hypothetical protein